MSCKKLTGLGVFLPEREGTKQKKKKREPKQPPLPALSAKEKDEMRAQTHVSGSREKRKDERGDEMRREGKRAELEEVNV